MLLDFCQNLPGDKDSVVMVNLMPCIKEMAIDANAHVKEALAKNLMALAPIVGKDKYVCLHMCVCVCLLMYMSAYVYVCICAYVYVCIYA